MVLGDPNVHNAVLRRRLASYLPSGIFDDEAGGQLAITTPMRWKLYRWGDSPYLRLVRYAELSTIIEE